MFTVKVGAVSGLVEIFTHARTGQRADFVCFADASHNGTAADGWCPTRRCPIWRSSGIA